MEWLKKLLEEQGLSEEQAKAIIEGVESNYKGYVPPHRFEEVNTAKKQAEEDVKERDKQLDKLKKSAGDNEELRQQIAKLQEENKAASEKYASDMKELRTSTALRLAIGDSAHDSELVLSLLDKAKIELDDDGNIKAGLDEQIQSLRESKAFLFVQKQEKDNENKGPTFKGMKPTDGTGGSSGHYEVDFEQMSDEEYYKYMEQQKNK
ncbi:hypothetical protein FLT15_07065 [Paenibacillus thiaminolyticus]|uniref:phage scaffolding protein n=1 Tax=Paenibacillus thiaminolyticus TaxID=49283 RepID=UPI0011659376|nr:phage scaffolding protein [Paenibacillus thiaminolyticus]NGP58158.1 hypothetical protein [Paenibacillus thiaminolyticus]